MKMKIFVFRCMIILFAYVNLFDRIDSIYGCFEGIDRL